MIMKHAAKSKHTRRVLLHKYTGNFCAPECAHGSAQRVFPRTPHLICSLDISALTNNRHVPDTRARQRRHVWQLIQIYRGFIVWVFKALLPRFDRDERHNPEHRDECEADQHLCWALMPLRERRICGHQQNARKQKLPSSQHVQLGLTVPSQHVTRPPEQPHWPPCHEQQPRPSFGAKLAWTGLRQATDILAGRVRPTPCRRSIWNDAGAGMSEVAAASISSVFIGAPSDRSIMAVFRRVAIRESSVTARQETLQSWSGCRPSRALGSAQCIRPPRWRTPLPQARSL